MIERGEIDVTIGEKRYTLYSTLAALKRINKEVGPPGEAFERVKVLDFHAIVVIIAAGAAVPDKQLPELEAEIFKAGLVTVSLAATTFIGLLINPTGEEVDEKEADAGK